MVMVGIPLCSGDATTLQMPECSTNIEDKVDPPKCDNVSEYVSWMDFMSMKERVYQAFSNPFVNQNRDNRDDEEAANIGSTQEDCGLLQEKEELQPCLMCLIANVEVNEPPLEEDLTLYNDDGGAKVCTAEEIEAVKKLRRGGSSHVQSDTMKENREEVEEPTIPTGMKEETPNDSAVSQVERPGDAENKKMNRETFVEATAEYLRKELIFYVESQMKTGKFSKASKKQKTEHLKKYLKKTLKAYVKGHRMLAHKSEKKNLQTTMDRMVTYAVDESDKSIRSEKHKKGTKGKKETVGAAGIVISGERTLLRLTESEKNVGPEGKKNSEEVKRDEQDSELLVPSQSKLLELKATNVASPNELLRNFVALEAKRLEELEQSLTQDKFIEVASQASEALRQLHEDITDSDSYLPSNVEKMDQEQVDIAIACEMSRLQKLQDEFLYKVKIAAHDYDDQSFSSRISQEETLTIEEELARLNKQANELTSRRNTLALTMHVISKEDI